MSKKVIRFTAIGGTFLVLFHPGIWITTDPVFRSGKMIKCVFPNVLIKSWADSKSCWNFAVWKDLDDIRLTTATHLKHYVKFDHLAEWGDGQDRGEKWYDISASNDSSSSSTSTEVTSSSEVSSVSSVSSSSSSESQSSDASSLETLERKKATQVYRTCNVCPHDMLKSWKNRGIKWICAGYQRAHRTFKSECMMRYRNCQDGTLFVKLHDHRCKNDSYYGRHWFYDYKT